MRIVLTNSAFRTVLATKRRMTSSVGHVGTLASHASGVKSRVHVRALRMSFAERPQASGRPGAFPRVAFHAS